MWFGRKPKAVEAEIRYLRDARVRPRIDAHDTSNTVVSLAAHRVRFHDVRAAEPPPSLDREGFRLLPHRSRVTDFHDATQHPLYCRELEQLMREVTRSSQVFISPTVVLRSRSHSPSSDGVIADGIADMVHADRTDRSVWFEARKALQHYGIETMPGGRLVSYNLWRALSPPPQDYPLALCDLRTVREEHLVRTDSISNAASKGQSVEFYLALFDPGHRWCYYSNLTPDEVLVFQQFDSAAKGPSGCPHTAFRNPACASPSATRLSAEARAYVFLPS